MSSKDWTKEIEALVPFVKGTALELGSSAPGQIPGVTPLPTAKGRSTPDWGSLADQSVDSLIALGATVMRDPVSEIQQWRRVLKEGGTLALVPARPGPPLWLIALLNNLGGFEISQAHSIRSGASWLVVGTRRDVCEIRGPLGTLGPRLAQLANRDHTCRAELYFQIGTILLQAGEIELATQCFGMVIDLEGRTAEGLLGLAMCHSSGDDWDEALVHLRRAIALAPQDEQIQRWLQMAEEKATA